MSHLEIIKKAYTECGIVFRVWTNPESGYQCLIKTGDRDCDYEHLTYDEAIHKCNSFMDFLSDGELASY